MNVSVIEDRMKQGELLQAMLESTGSGDGQDGLMLAPTL